MYDDIIYFFTENEVVLGTESLAFERVTKRCTTISAVDDNVSEGTHSSQLIVEASGSTVPTEVYPNSIPVVIIDNDGN